MIAFAAILAASTIIYLLGRLKAPRTSRNREKISMYACGETFHPRRLAINITLYKYLVYFIILDSSVLIMAFASLATSPTSLAPLMIYLFTIFAAVLLLSADGG